MEDVNVNFVYRILNVFQNIVASIQLITQIKNVLVEEQSITTAERVISVYLASQANTFQL